MDFLTLWKLIGLGMEADFEKRMWTVKVGPFEAKGIKFITLKALSDDPVRARILLSNLFNKPAIMWMDFRAERVDDCMTSLSALEQAVSREAEVFSQSSRSQDQFLAGLLLTWSTACKQARCRLESAIDDERDPMNTGMDISARDAIAPTLADFRRSSFPAVQLLQSILREDDPVLDESIKKLQAAKDELIRYYGVRVDELASPSLEPEVATSG